MSRLLTTARMAQQAGGMAVGIKIENRENLSANVPVQLQKLTKEGLIQKLTLMSDTTHNELAECYNMLMRVETLKLC
jgi:hypothetical protein